MLYLWDLIIYWDLKQLQGHQKYQNDTNHVLEATHKPLPTLSHLSVHFFKTEKKARPHIVKQILPCQATCFISKTRTFLEINTDRRQNEDSLSSSVSGIRKVTLNYHLILVFSLVKQIGKIWYSWPRWHSWSVTGTLGIRKVKLKYNPHRKCNWKNVY